MEAQAEPPLFFWHWLRHHCGSVASGGGTAPDGSALPSPAASLLMKQHHTNAILAQIASYGTPFVKILVISRDFIVKMAFGWFTHLNSRDFLVKRVVGPKNQKEAQDPPKKVPSNNKSFTKSGHFLLWLFCPN